MNLDVDLELVPASEPGFSRRPDLIILDGAAGERIDAEGGLVRASEVLLVAEIVSPDTRRIDHVDKTAGLCRLRHSFYWMIDLDDRVATGIFRTETPFPVEINLDQLRS